MYVVVVNIKGRAIERVEDGEDKKRVDSWEKNSQERAALGLWKVPSCPVPTVPTVPTGNLDGRKVLRGPSCGETACNGQERLF